MKEAHPLSMAALFGADRRPGRFPPNPMAAMFVAMVYRRMGGWFTIDSNGKRYTGVAEPIFLDGQTGEPVLPQLPDAKPHERFHSADEWRGAVKLLDALLRRMDRSDTDTIFEIMASVAVDERGFTPSIEDPKRGAESC